VSLVLACRISSWAFLSSCVARSRKNSTGLSTCTTSIKMDTSLKRCVPLDSGNSQTSFMLHQGTIMPTCRCLTDVKCTTFSILASRCSLVACQHYTLVTWSFVFFKRTTARNKKKEEIDQIHYNSARGGHQRVCHIQMNSIQYLWRHLTSKPHMCQNKCSNVI